MKTGLYSGSDVVAEESSAVRFAGGECVQLIWAGALSGAFEGGKERGGGLEQ